MKAIIVDDEIGGRETLSMMVKEFCPDVTVIDAVESVKSAIEAINRYKPDLLFLDIELQDGSGFDILDKIILDNLIVIFITAYNQYAIKAFKYNAVDYLLKPIDASELIRAVKKGIENHQRNTGFSEQQIKNLVENYRSQNKAKKLYVNTVDNIFLIDKDNIVRMKADTSYTHIFMINGEKITASKPLKEYEQLLLSDDDFLRVHQSHLVNMTHVKKYTKSDGGYLVMSDGVKIEVSVRKRAEILAKFQNE